MGGGLEGVRRFFVFLEWREGVWEGAERVEGKGVWRGPILISQMVSA